MWFFMEKGYEIIGNYRVRYDISPDGKIECIYFTGKSAKEYFLVGAPLTPRRTSSRNRDLGNKLRLMADQFVLKNLPRKKGVFEV